MPVTILPDGSSSMKDPEGINTLRQGMNNYVSATFGMYSACERANYTLILGGMTYQYFEDGEYKTDPEIPFTNQIVTIKRDKNRVETQHLMSASYPTILSKTVHAGNELLFGAGAAFFPKTKAKFYDNGVLKFDLLKKGKTHIGYIVGGIQSTLPNTSSKQDTKASSYIFKVYVKKK